MTHKLITSPTYALPYDFECSLFLGGGISNCPDWQESFISQLDCKRTKKITIFNPRRKSFVLTDTQEEIHQVMWEHSHLRSTESVLFWFPRESVCPITLFELGTVICDHKNYPYRKIFVGIEPGYSKETNIRTQIGLYAPRIKVASSITELANQVSTWFDDHYA